MMSSERILATGTSRTIELFRAAYYTLFQKIIGISGLSPRVAYALGGMLGLLRMQCGYIGRDRSRRVYLQMLKRALPSMTVGDHRRILRDFWINHQKNLIELFLIDRWPKKFLADRICFENLAALDQSLARGRGVVLAVPHFGNERLVHLALGYHGYNVAVVTSRFDGAHPRVVNAKLNAAFTWNKVRFPDQEVRWLYRFLLDGGIVQLSFTAPGGPKDPIVNFLHHDVRLSGVPARLSLTTGATLIPVYDYRTPDNMHRIVFDQPMEMPTSVSKSFWWTLTEKLIETMQRRILHDPGQFYWMWLVIRSQELNQ